ncbi:MAG: o-succinylbenzoate--CoA ligase [Actinomycetia bacterium]|nr:o-succinylbenzoate--CoA ligase [Actinomycetes bacterium]
MSPLTPIQFLDRAAFHFAERTGYVDDTVRYSYRELADRCARLAGGLRSLGVEPGDRVSVLAPNTNVALEAHFGVPSSGAVLNMLNIRLAFGELDAIVGHAEPGVLLLDAEYADTGARLAAGHPGLQVVVAGGDPDEYEALIAAANPYRHALDDEHALLALNYTSGTTGTPKGVMYAHRGAFLQSVAMVAAMRLEPGSVHLWTLPMFHCNGWCFPWAVTAAGAAHVGMRRVDPEAIWAAVREHGVTHFNAAPTVLNDFAFSASAADGPAPDTVRVGTGGAPPSPALLERLGPLNVDVTHLYGLTECYGPAVVCAWQPEWDAEPAAVRARLQARQGVTNVCTTGVQILTAEGGFAPADGVTTGEIVIRGNNVMSGYYRDPEATAAAFVDGWLRTGDIGVLQPDGYLEIRDRVKDIIISGGENISSIEVEHALASHAAVQECAVVAAPDDRWGEIPVAFVTLRPGEAVSAEVLIEHVKGRVARFKAPKRVVFADLPKTATGKIQKFMLRESFASTSHDPAV